MSKYPIRTFYSDAATDRILDAKKPRGRSQFIRDATAALTRIDADVARIEKEIKAIIKRKSKGSGSGSRSRPAPSQFYGDRLGELHQELKVANKFKYGKEAPPVDASGREVARHDRNRASDSRGLNIKVPGSFGKKRQKKKED